MTTSDIAIILCQSPADGKTSLGVRLDLAPSVSELFSKDVKTVNEHLKKHLSRKRMNQDEVERSEKRVLRG